MNDRTELWERLYMWLNDMHLGISPDESTPDDERKCRMVQTDVIEDIMGWIEANVLESKALEKEPCEDCISRTEAINAIHTTMHKFFNTSDDPEPFNDKDKLLLNVNKAITNFVKELPAVTPSYNSINTELKSSGDYISRQAAVDVLKNLDTIISPISDDVLLIDKAEAMAKLIFLPTVTMHPKRRMRLFKIIDNNTGKEPTYDVITEQAKLGNLMTDDIDGFYVNENGQIILVDDCGNCTWLGMNRFDIESEVEG